MKIRRKKIARLVVTSMIAGALLMPIGVYATTPTTLQTAGADIVVEYRYTEGEEGNVNIPDTIKRYGLTYKLKEKQPAVLEATLPSTRTYSWSINGFITEAQAEELKEEYPGLVLTPAYRDGTESVDITQVIEDLPVNDVELIPFTISHNQSELRRAAVQFEITRDENGALAYDRYGLPASYTAEVIYRGLAAVQVPGYYQAAQTYETSEALGDVAQYVIITTYSPMETPVVPVTSSTTTTGSGDAADPQEDPIPIGSLVDDPVPADEAEPAATVIEDEETPQAAGESGSRVKTILLNIVKIVLIAIAAFAGFIGVLILRKKIRRARRMRRRAAYQ